MTYDRPDLLHDLIKSLAVQEDDNFQLAILDNGSSQSPLSHLSDLLPSFRYRPIVHRIEKNQWSAIRVQLALSLLDTEFAVMPGDDDTALPNFVSTLTLMLQRSSSISFASAASLVVNELGELTGTKFEPSQFTGKADALSSLLCGNGYSLPSTAFRRQLALDTNMPRTLSSIDWWLWLKGWIHGSVETSSDSILHYRVHSKQQQHAYGRSLFALDGIRMIFNVIDNSDFKDAVTGFSQSEKHLFADRILNNATGLNIGRGPWWPLAQIRLADVLSGIIADEHVQAIYTQAAVNLGVVPPLNSVSALIEDSTLVGLPQQSWTRIKLAVKTGPECVHTLSWLQFMGLEKCPSEGHALLKIDCGCHKANWNSHVKIGLSYPAHSYLDFDLDLPENPDDGNTMQLRYRLGEAARFSASLQQTPRLLRMLESTYARWGGHSFVRVIRKRLG